MCKVILSGSKEEKVENIKTAVKIVLIIVAFSIAIISIGTYGGLYVHKFRNGDSQKVQVQGIELSPHEKEFMRESMKNVIVKMEYDEKLSPEFKEWTRQSIERKLDALSE